MKELIKFTDKHTVMSDNDDILIESYIFKYFKPKIAYEIGAGSGNWCATINEFARTSTLYYLVENFELLKTFPTLDMPFNESQLRENLSDFNINYKLIIDSIDNLKQTPEPIDLVRLDCDPIDYDKFVQWIFDNSSDNLVILSDDIMPNRCPQRFMTFQEQVGKGNLKLIWVGVDTAAWVKPSTKIDDFYDYIIGNLEDYYDVLKVIDDYSFFGIPQRHLVSRLGKPYQRFLYK